MKKRILYASCLLLVITCVCGCSLDEYEQQVEDIIKEETKPNVSCSVEKQYGDDYGFSYYIEGTCVNNGSKNYDYLQVEFICYDKEGNNLGTALDNTNNLLSGQTWKFKAMSLSGNDENIDHCDYHEVTGW